MTTAPAVHNVRPELAEHLVPIDSIQPHPDNARVGDVEFVRQSLRKFGQYRVCVVDEDQRIAVGTHMWKAAKAEGWTHIAAILTPLDEGEAREMRLTDNRSHDRGRYDEQALMRELDALVAYHSDKAGEQGEEIAQLALAGVGYDERTLHDLRKITQGAPVNTPPEQFNDPEASMTTDYQCPSCHYEWSGNPRGGE